MFHVLRGGYLCNGARALQRRLCVDLEILLVVHPPVTFVGSVNYCSAEDPASAFGDREVRGGGVDAGVDKATVNSRGNLLLDRRVARKERSGQRSGISKNQNWSLADILLLISSWQ